MKSIERADGLEREWAASAFDDLFVNAEDNPMRGGQHELGFPISCFYFGHLIHGHRTDQNPIGFNERQIRRDDNLGGSQELSDGLALFLT